MRDIYPRFLHTALHSSRPLEILQTLLSVSAHFHTIPQHHHPGRSGTDQPGTVSGALHTAHKGRGRACHSNQLRIEEQNRGAVRHLHGHNGYSGVLRLAYFPAARARREPRHHRLLDFAVVVLPGNHHHRRAHQSGHTHRQGSGLCSVGHGHDNVSALHCISHRPGA